MGSTVCNYLSVCIFFQHTVLNIFTIEESSAFLDMVSKRVLI